MPRTVAIVEEPSCRSHLSALVAAPGAATVAATTQLITMVASTCNLIAREVAGEPGILSRVFRDHIMCGQWR